MNKIETGTIIRTICLALALINQMLVMSGHSVIPIEDANVEALVTNLATVIAALVTWWKNNSYTKAAIAGDATMKELKAQNKVEGK